MLARRPLSYSSFRCRQTAPVVAGVQGRAWGWVLPDVVAVTDPASPTPGCVV